MKTVSSKGVVTNGMAKELTNILRPLVGNSHQIRNTYSFVDRSIPSDWRKRIAITSYDVRALYTTVQWTLPSPSNISCNRTHNYITEHPCLYITSSHFLNSAPKMSISSPKVSIKNRYMVQPWIPPISPIPANLFTEEFEIKAIKSAANPLRLWLRYVDDTSVIQRQNITTSSYNTSTPQAPTYISLQRHPTLMDPYISRHHSLSQTW